MAEQLTLRQKKISEQIKRVLSTIIFNKIFPQIYSTEILAITRVKVSADLQNAKIYCDPGTKESDDMLSILNSNQAELRYMMAKELIIKYVPMLKFFKDDKIIAANKLQEAMKREAWNIKFEDNIK